MKKLLSEPEHDPIKRMTEGPIRLRAKRRTRQPNGSPAQKTIDACLVKALEERAIVTKKVSALVYYQDRLSRLNAEIEALIGYQQRLMGHPVAPGGYPPAVPDGWTAPTTPYSQTFSHTAEIPPGIGSMPTKQPHPAPTPNGNAADVISSEGGFN